MRTRFILLWGLALSLTALTAGASAAHTHVNKQDKSQEFDTHEAFSGAAAESLDHISDEMRQHLSSLEDRVYGGKAPTVQGSMKDRAAALEQYVFGSTSSTEVFSVAERIGNLENKVFGDSPLAHQLATMGDTESLRSEDSMLLGPLLQQYDQRYDDDFTVWGKNFTRYRRRHDSISTPTTTTSAVISGFSEPGRYYGYPNVYHGPGLPPFSYGAYPGSPGWWDSSYRQSGMPYTVQAPYFPWAANRVGYGHHR